MLPMNDMNKGPIRVNTAMESILVNFTVDAMMSRPKKLLPYAVKYFKDLKVKQEAMCDPDIDFDNVGQNWCDCKDMSGGAYNIELLYKLLRNCPLLKVLEKDEIMLLIDHIHPRKVTPEEIVILQEDKGDEFFVIEKGEFEAWIESESGQEMVYKYANVGSFGELALLYDQPRAATIKATTEGFIWAIDRQTFRKMVASKVLEKRKSYIELFERSHMFENLTLYQKLCLADEINEKVYRDGDVIVAQDSDCEGLYFVQKGEVSTCRFVDPNGFVEIARVKGGEYFGDVEYMQNIPMVATSKAIGETKIGVVVPEVIERFLSHCADIIQEKSMVKVHRMSQRFGSSVFQSE